MKVKWIMAIIGNLWACFAHTQENLVPNPGFELGKQPQCQTHYSGSSVGGSNHPQDFEDDLDFWSLAAANGKEKSVSPDYIDSSTKVCEYNCGGFPYYPRYTPRYVGMGGTEGVRNSLTRSLQAGKTYHLRFLLRGTKGDARMVIAVWGQHWNANQSGNSKYQFGRLSDIQPPVPHCVWRIVQMTLTIPLHENNLKNLVFSSEEASYFAIDDVELFEACPDTMHVQDRRYHPLSFPEPEEAGHIRAGYRVTNSRTPGDVVVKNGTVIQYKGAEQVSLEDGFYVEPGGDFHAYIAPCGMRCPPFNINRDVDTVICTSKPFMITGDPSSNCTYVWEAANPADLQYLEGVNTYSPLFTPPLVGLGYIRYTLKVTNSCGELYYRHVNIKYNMMGTSAPAFTVQDSTLTDVLAFTLKLPRQTEKVKIELLSCTSSAVLLEYEYNAFEDFDDTLRWELPDEVNLCECYNVRISSKNFCNPQWYSRTISWPLQPRSNYTINVPNVVSSVDGCRYCFTVTGGQLYHIKVITRSGQHVFEETRPISGSEVCSWYAADWPFAEYYATMEVTDCSGQVHHYTFTIMVTCSKKLAGHIKPDDRQILGSQATYTESAVTGGADIPVVPNALTTYAVPNPINHDPEIVYHLPEAGKVSLHLFDQNMRLLQVIEEKQEREAGTFRVKFDAQRLPQGVYYYRFEFTNTRGEYQSRYVRLLK